MLAAVAVAVAATVDAAAPRQQLWLLMHLVVNHLLVTYQLGYLAVNHLLLIPVPSDHLLCRCRTWIWMNLTEKKAAMLVAGWHWIVTRMVAVVVAAAFS